MLVAAGGPFEAGPLAVTELALDRLRTVTLAHGQVSTVGAVAGTVVTHAVSLPVGVGGIRTCWHAERR